jgi:integrase
MKPYKRLDPDEPGFREAHYYCTITVGGHRYQRCLQTNQVEVAITRARAMQRKLEGAHAAGRFDEITGTKLRKDAVSSLGQIFAVYRHRTRVKPRTTIGNVSSMRTIVRVVSQRQLTDEEVDSMPATILTRATLRQYQDTMVKGLAGEEKSRAMTTANSTMRQARSILSRAMVEDGIYAEEKIRLPDLSGFRAQRLFPEPNHMFTPIPSTTLAAIWTAAPELAAADPEAYKAFLLSICCGLRRGEAAGLCWSQIVELNGRHLIRLGVTKNGQPRLIPVEDTVWKELRSASGIVPITQPTDPAEPAATSATVLSGTATDRWRHTFDRMGKWLAAHGWDRSKKAHELRKHYGSQLATQLGTRTAALILGNTEPVLRAHYDALLAVPEITTFQTPKAS